MVFIGEELNPVSTKRLWTDCFCLLGPILPHNTQHNDNGASKMVRQEAFTFLELGHSICPNEADVNR